MVATPAPTSCAASPAIIPRCCNTRRRPFKSPRRPRQEYRAAYAKRDRVDMSVETIFRQLHDPATWPEPPERPLLPASAADLRPAVVIPMPIEALKPWAPLPSKDETG